MNTTTDKCKGCGQFVGPDGQWGAVAPSDRFGDPDYEYAIYVCSETCADIIMERYGFEHWWAHTPENAS